MMFFQARIPFLKLAVSVIFLLDFVASEAVQYCKDGAEINQVDFCMGMLMHHNVSTTSHDLYLTMTVTRPNSTSLGWTALGLGEVMDGALIFIVYGDPLSAQPPIVSIRKSVGHSQPTLVTREDMNGADLRVMRADWHDSPSDPRSAVAMISLVCYSCHLWPGTPISVTSTSQPWIWAWNSGQEIPVFTYDAHLKMHVHHAGAGGWGNFYADMPRSVNNWHNLPSFPPITPGLGALGVSERPGISTAYGIAWLKQNWMLHLHGITMGVSFLFLFPIGVLALRSGSTRGFKYHWVLQAFACGLTSVGFILGLILGRKIGTVHQVVGISTVACVVIQCVLGWRHHMVFLRLRHRTWLSYAHIWLGRLIIIGGCSNIFTGLLLRGYSGLLHLFLGSLVGSEAIGMTSWLWWIKNKASPAGQANKMHAEEHENNGDRYFALGDDEDEDATSVSEHSGDEEAKPMIETSKDRS